MAGHFHRCIEELLEEVKFLNEEHTRSCQMICSLRNTHARYRRMICAVEAIQPLGSDLLTERLHEYLQYKGWFEATALRVNEEFSRGITKLREYVHNTRLRVERILIPAPVHRSDNPDVNTNLELQLQNLVLSTPVPWSADGDEIDMKTVASPAIDAEIEEEGSSDEDFARDFLHVLRWRVIRMLYYDLIMKENIVDTLGHHITPKHMDVYVMNWTLRSSMDPQVWETALREMETRLL